MPRRALAFALAICALALQRLAFQFRKPRREDEARYADYGFMPGINDFADCLQREPRAALRNSAATVGTVLGILGRPFGTALCITAITVGWLTPVGHISIKRRSDLPRYSRIPDRTLRLEFRRRPRPESCEAPSAPSSTRN
jgi:hypothetical protein